MTDKEACVKCNGLIPASDWSVHQRRLHLWHPIKSFTCSNCPYKTHESPDFFGHALLEGHQLTAPAKSWFGDVNLARPDILLQQKSMTPTNYSATEIEIENLSIELDQKFDELADKSPELPIQSAVSAEAPSKKDKLCCRKCDSSLKCDSVAAVNHAMACNLIKPFVCSKCRSPFAQKGSLKLHINKRCPEATVMMVDKGKNEAAVRQCLQECFPEHQFKWNGWNGQKAENTYTDQKRQGATRLQTENSDETPMKTSGENVPTHSVSKTSNKTPLKTSILTNTRAQSKPPVTEPATLTCAKCHSEIKLRKDDGITHSVQHVVVCFGLRPFQCNGCAYKAARRDKVRCHQGRKCPGTEVEIVDKEANEKAVKKGLEVCFPGRIVYWSGWQL